MSVKISSTGKGLLEILANLKSPSVKKVEVGIHGNTDSEILAYARAHEFGLGNQVPRPFIRQSFDKNADELKEIGVDFGKQVGQGKINLGKALNSWGMALVTMINSEINDGDNFTPNTPERLKQKGADKHPLQDEGRLQESIKAVVS